MAKYLFTLGRPGSGKSAIGRAIMQTYGGARNVIKMNDYPLLEEMFLQEEHGLAAGPKQFRRVEKGASIGFEVLDPQVFPLTLCLLNEQAHRYLHDLKLIIIEFARHNYTDIVRYFQPDILRNAHVLFMQLPLEACIQRIQRRVEERRYEDDRLVSESTLRARYQDDGLASLLAVCDPAQVSVINNEGKRHDTWLEVKSRVDELLYRVNPPSQRPVTTLNQAWRPFNNPKREPSLI